jgi:Fe-S cluster biogenesis protein NfuA
MADQTATEAIISRIKSIIENDVRPYIEMDGGRIDFVRYESEVVYVQLSGACVGCPASALTLKGGVERQIRRRVPEVRAVELHVEIPDDACGNPLPEISL